jgi:hypothetical protein
VADRIIQVADGFWNIRGSFRVGGVLEIGTQSSLVRCADGRFVLLDSYTLAGEVERTVLELTDGGEAIDAILNLHPFHTIHVRAVHERFPNARLYGSSRHVEKKSELPWQDLRVDNPEMHALFADDLTFSVPRGVDFISANDKVHFSSVLAFHAASRTLHVDDTLMYSKLPLVGGVVFHLTLAQALERRAGAAADFRAWALEIAERCQDIDNLCAAHTRPLLAVAKQGDSLDARVRTALAKSAKTLDSHERRYGA